jgi:serine/threonine protein kinase
VRCASCAASGWQACLTKDPLERPSASELLQHDWIQLQLFDPELKLASQRQIDEGEGSAAPAGVKDALLRSLNRARSVSGMFARRSTNMSITSMGAPAAKPTLWGRVAGAAMGWFTGRGGGAGGGLGGGGDGGAGAARGAGRGGGKRGGVLPTSVVQVEDYHRSFHWAPSQGALTTRSSGLNLQPQAQQQQQQQQQQAPMTPLVKRTASEHSSKASREVGNREGTGATPSEVGSRVNIFGIPGL